MKGDLPRLYVEGPDDAHATANLLRRFGVHVLVQTNRLRELDESVMAVVVQAGGKEQALPLWSESAGRVGGAPVAVVLDADDSAARTWERVRGKCQSLGLKAPGELPPGGYVDTSGEGVRVGAWIMPDNGSSGALEEFLAALIPSKNLLWPLAVSSTRTARTLEPGRSDAWESKAQIRAWLAWQEEPGHRYGEAVSAGSFGHEGEAAHRFVAWFRRVFDAR